MTDDEGEKPAELITGFFLPNISDKKRSAYEQFSVAQRAFIFKTDKKTDKQKKPFTIDAIDETLFTPEVSEIMKRVIETSPERRKGMIDRLLALSDVCKKPRKGNEELKKIRRGRWANCKPPRQKKFHKPPIPWTRERIINVLRDLMIRSKKPITIKRLKELKKQYPNDYPSTNWIYDLFKDPNICLSGWAIAIRMAGGLLANECRKILRTYNNILNNVDVYQSVNYYMALAQNLNIKTGVDYCRARKNYPDIVPPIEHVIKTFGSFKAYKKLILIEDCREQLTRLLTLMKNLNGRWPRKRLCRANLVDRRFLERKFGGRLELEETCRELLMLDEAYVNRNKKEKKIEDKTGSERKDETADQDTTGQVQD